VLAASQEQGHERCGFVFFALLVVAEDFFELVHKDKQFGVFRQWRVGKDCLETERALAQLCL
jgi:hypothetical protein